MLRNTLLLVVAGVALAGATGCSSLTRPDEIRIVADVPVSVQPARAPGQPGPTPPRPVAPPGGG